MIKEYFFPTIIYAKDLENANVLNTYLEHQIINWSKEDKGVNKTNVNGWHSKTDMNNRKEYESIIQELFKMYNEIIEEEHLDIQPKLGNMWANINLPNSYNNSHIHPNSLFSGVYYVKSKPNSGRLHIMDPRPGAQLIMPRRKKGIVPMELWRDAYLEPVPGRLIMFPAWLWHKVELNKSNDMRISISFNFIL
tara:strand:+ start:97 stop:675 length:579 start_codon:yes stop_codon:yes gene_type:complete